MVDLKSSLTTLLDVAAVTHTDETFAIASALWRRDLNADNPLWSFVESQSFQVENNDGVGHVIAFTDQRLPNAGFLGYFACTSAASGARTLKQATRWLVDCRGAKHVYGPINGTITSDYRLNLSEDHWFSGEPVNPKTHIHAFEAAGFSVFNRYVTAALDGYEQALGPILSRTPTVGDSYRLRNFDAGDQLGELKKYHDLMNAIFPAQSIYCPVISFDERAYNFSASTVMFDADYSYFLEHRGQPVGFVVAYPHDNQLILKTIGLLPNHRGGRLFASLLHAVHSQAVANDLQSAVYGIVREGNAVANMKPRGATIERRYVTMVATG